MAISEKTGINTLMPVLNITLMNAGVKQNIVPDKCTMKGDRRFIPEEKFDDVCKEFEQLPCQMFENKHPEIESQI